MAKLIAIALSCRAMYGIRPSAATRVTTAANHASLPSRVAIRSAIDVALVSRASCTSRSMNTPASAYNRNAPTKVGGRGTDRKSGGAGKSVSDRVDLGGGGEIK